MSSLSRLRVSPVSQTDVSRLHLDEMPTCLTISRMFRSIVPSLFGLGIAKSYELRKVIAAIARIVRERRSRGTCNCDTRTQLRNLHITLVGLCARVTLDRRTHAYMRTRTRARAHNIYHTRDNRRYVKVSSRCAESSRK